MKNRKGFSLIELMGVLVIIGLILLVVIPAVSRLLTSNDKKQYSKYLDIIEAGAIRYADSRKDDLGGHSDTGCVDISIEDLIEEDYIKEYNDDKVACTGKVRLDNKKGNLKVSIDLTCKNKDDDEVTFEVKNVNEEDACIAYEYQEPIIPGNPNTPGDSSTITLANKILKDNVAYPDNVSSQYVGASTGINFGTISGIGPYRSIRTSTNETSYFTSTYKYATEFTYDYSTGKYSLAGTFYSGSPSTMTQLFGTYKYTCKNQSGTNCTKMYQVATASSNSSAWTAFTYSSTSVTESTYNGQGLYYTSTNTEDNKVTYYYRGNVANNFVQFGKNSSGNNLYWRIIRINEDGSVRLIYNGTSTSSSGSDVTIGIGKYNNSLNDNAYIGYMYGTANSSSYISTHSNSNNSAIKNSLDNWYVSNLSKYSEYLSIDAGFCNDRSLYSGTGIKQVYTEYGGFNRLNTNKTPQFKCNNAETDLFTPTSANKGNKKLNYPIGLITIDEVAYAGGVLNSLNLNYYLYSGNEYWTISPHYYYYFYSTSLSISRSEVYSISKLGEILGKYTNADGVRIRPVINLKTDVNLSSELPSGCTELNGTASCPYIIKTS